MNSVDNVNTSHMLQKESLFKKPLPTGCVPRIQELITSKTTYDTFGNCTIDLSSCKEFSEKDNSNAAKLTLATAIETETKNNKHIFSLKLAPSQSRLHKIALDSGMTIHHANSECSWIIKCLKGHEEKKCSYPKYKTVSVGISGVVFNNDLTKFLAVKEVSGPYRGWKAPTGTVDYEVGENPLDTVVREISEETNLKLSPQDARFIGTGWTKNFRGNNPDVNYAFAFKCTDSTQKLRAQEAEILKVEWISYKEFMETPANVPNENTFILKSIVEAAYKALQSGNGWDCKPMNWGSGKPVTLFSNL